MPTNRPFFANFFAAFRAHTNPTYGAKSSSTTSAASSSLAASAHVSTTPTTVTSSTPRTINAKPSNAFTSDNGAQTQIGASATTGPMLSQSRNPATVTSSPFSAAVVAAAAAAAAASAHHPPRYPHPTPYSRSPGTSSPGGPLSHNHHANMSISPPGASTPRGRQRRGSDSSNSSGNSGGFIDALGAEKWYIGGRTTTGEERFYRLGLVTAGPSRRVRSLDRLSL